MGLFYSEAHVNLSEVEGFRQSVEEFRQLIESMRHTVAKDLRDSTQELEVRAKELAAQSKECEAIYQEVQHKKRDIEHRISELHTQLAKTPKEIEKPAEGEGESEKKPNPEYQRLRQEIKKQEARIGKIKELSWAVYNKRSEIERDAQYVQSAVGEVADGAQKISRMIAELEQKSTTAKTALQQVEGAIRAYGLTRIKK